MKVRDGTDVKASSGNSPKRVAFKVATIVLLIAVAVASSYAGLKMAMVRNSPEFATEKSSAYLFYESVDPERLNLIRTQISQPGSLPDSYLILVYGDRGAVEIVRIPAFSYFHSKKVNVADLAPMDFLDFIAASLGVKVDYTYLVPLSKFLAGHGVSNLKDLVSHYSRRGLGFLDYFLLGGRVTGLRPESNLTEPALAKLYYLLRSSFIREHSLPTFTRGPMKVTVAGKTYVRNYVDEGSLEKLRTALSHGN